MHMCTRASHTTHATEHNRAIAQEYGQTNKHIVYEYNKYASTGTDNRQCIVTYTQTEKKNTNKKRNTINNTHTHTSKHGNTRYKNTTDQKHAVKQSANAQYSKYTAK